MCEQTVPMNSNFYLGITYNCYILYGGLLRLVSTGTLYTNANYIDYDVDTNAVSLERIHIPIARLTQT